MDAWKTVVEKVETECRNRRIPMLGREKAEFLADLVRRRRPERVVECGTAIGYSSLWIARVLDELDCGQLITIEIDPERAQEAQGYLEQAGLSHRVELLVGDARERVQEVPGPVAMVHLDNGYRNYYPCFRALEPKLAPEAIVVADNVGIGADEMADYLRYVRERWPSQTYWFQIDLPWVQHDAMEVTVVP